MGGINRHTGKPLNGFPHVVQSVQVLFVTAIGSRRMRRTVGSAVPAILGRSLTPQRILRWKAAIVVAMELWEKRFKIVFIHGKVNNQGHDNTPEKLRVGRLAMTLEGEYRPRGHLGDPTPETSRMRTIEL